MANWTVSSSATTIAQGTSVSGATKVLTITPNVGYVVSASNFKIGNGTETSSGSKTWTAGGGTWNVDTGITQVVFADTGTTGTPTNTVTATVTFSTFTMPSSNKTLYIDIDEVAATQNELRNVCIRSKHIAEIISSEIAVNKHTVTTTSETGITQTDDSSSVGVSGTHTYYHQGQVPEGTAAPGNLIFTKVFATNTTYGYFYLNAPTFTFAVTSGYGDYSNYYTVVQSDEVYTSVTINGVTSSELTGVTFKCYYTPPVAPTTPPGLDPDPFSTAAAMCELNQYIQFSHVMRQEDQGSPGDKKYVNSVNTDTSDLLSAGEVRNIRVNADVGAVYKLVVTRTDDGNTYDFTSNTFTAGATTSAETTTAANGFDDFLITYPSTSSTDTYDITIDPTTPTSTLVTVPINAGDLRLSQFQNIVVTLGLDDSASKYNDAAFPTAITITAPANKTFSDSDLSREFSYTVTAASLNAGDSAIDPLTGGAYDFSLDSAGEVITLTDGNVSSATFDVDSTTGIAASDTINWTIQKTPLYKLENESVIFVGELTEDTSLTIPANYDNLVAGMKVTANNIRVGVEISSVSGDSIVLSEAITTDPAVPITFTSAGVTVSSITDGNTLVASQDLSGVKDNFSLSFGSSSTDTTANVISGTVTDAHPNVTLAGTFVVTQSGDSNVTVKMDIEKLITRS